MNRAAVAILLISADFLASDFIANNELPPLLSASQNEGVKIIPVIIKPCAFANIPELSKFQAINDPSSPVIANTEVIQEALWCSIAQEVKAALEENLHQQKKQYEILSNNGKNRIQRAAYKPSENPNLYSGLCSEELRNPSVVSEFYAFSYHYLDDLSFMVEPARFFDGFTTYNELMRLLKNRFKLAGWEGDGDIQVFWLPPFVGAGVEDTHGVCVWHVKQSNNGTSWLLSPVRLPFGRLLEQQR